VRFTLKTLLAAVSVAAVVCCVFFAMPFWLSLGILALFWFMAPAALIAGIVYGRGYGRAFSIGCVSAGGCVPIIYLYYAYAILLSGLDSIDLSDGEGAAGIKLAFAAFFILVGLSGLTSMGVRWLSLRWQRKAEPPRPPARPEYSVLQGRVTTIQMESTPVAAEPSADASVPSS
jgi:hypothetical protein